MAELGRRAVLAMLIVILAAGITHAELEREGIVLKSSTLLSGPDLSVSIDGNRTECHQVYTVVNKTVFIRSLYANLTIALTVLLQPGVFTPSEAQNVTFRVTDNRTAAYSESHLELQSAGGSTFTLFPKMVSATIPQQTHEVKVEVDPENYLPETNEANNSYSTTVRC